MRKILCRLSVLVLAAHIIVSTPVVSFGAQDPVDEPEVITHLRNSDILAMVKQKIPARIIIAKIRSSSCSFDTFPPVMRELRLKGVPASVLKAMVASPSGPPSGPPVDEAYEQPIYHFAEDLRQMGVLANNSGKVRNETFRPDRSRARITLRRRGL